VDVLSSVVVASVPPVAVDTESWMILLWQMQEQGLQCDKTVSDGGKAIANAVHKVAPESIHQRDVWHVLHECQKVQGRVKRAVNELHEQMNGRPNA
jgi:transposase-like protein